MGLCRETCLRTHGWALGHRRLVPSHKHTEPPRNRDHIARPASQHRAPVNCELSRFEPDQILMVQGQQSPKTYIALKGCNTVSFNIPTNNILRNDWRNNTSFQQYQAIASVGGKPIRGPMLVIQGSIDPIAYPPSVTSAINRTIAADPSASIEYHELPNVSHAPAMYAGLQIYLDWIAARFSGQPVKKPGFARYDAQRNRLRRIGSCRRRGSRGRLREGNGNNSNGMHGRETCYVLERQKCGDLCSLSSFSSPLIKRLGHLHFNTSHRGHQSFDNTYGQRILGTSICSLLAFLEKLLLGIKGFSLTRLEVKDASTTDEDHLGR